MNFLGQDIRLRRIVVAVVLCPVFAQAVEVWDDGGGNDNWSTSQNWVSNTVPSAFEDTIFDTTPASSNQTVRPGNNRQVGNITISGNYDYLFENGSFVTPTYDTVWSITGSGDVEFDSKINIDGSRISFQNDGTGFVEVSGSLSSWSSGSTFALDGTGATTVSGKINGGVNFEVNSGTNTITSQIQGGANILVSGGTNIFDTDIPGGATLDITGGDSTVTGKISGGVTIDVDAAGGGLTIQGTIAGGATIDVNEGDLRLEDDVGGGAQVTVASGGTLLLGDGVGFSGGSNVELAGGTLAPEGNVSIPNLTLSADSVIDLNNDPTAQVYLGNITGGATVNIVQYNDTGQITFNPGGSTIDVGSQIFFDGVPAQVIGNEIVPGAAPIPEPGTILGGILLLGVCFWHQRRKPPKATQQLAR